MLEKKLEILEIALGDYHQHGEEYLFWCPAPWCKHHKPKLSVNIHKNKFKCWICGYKGDTIHRLVRRFGDRNQYLDWCEVSGIIDLSDPDNFDLFGEDIIKPPPVTLPKEFQTLTGKPTLLSRNARKYLFTRGITDHDILWWKIGYCPDGKYKDRIIIPSFDLEGRVNYFVARNYADDWIPYKNPPAPKDLIFNELYLDWNKDISLVEGVFDAVVAGNAIPLLGSTLRENSYIFEKIVLSGQRIFSALDPDAKEKEDSILSLLRSYGVETYKVIVKPFQDVGSMEKSVYQQRKSEAKLVESCDEIERLLEAV